VTIVFATSYLDEAERCGRVALLHDGVVLACDTPAQLKRQMQGSVLELRAAEPRTAAAILRPALVSEAGVDLCGDRVHLVTSAPAVVADRAREILRAHAMTDVAVRAVEPSLEDVFVIRLAGAHDGIGATAMQDKPTAGADALISPTTPNNATPTGAMPPAVAIDHLERRFGEFVAVNRISLTVRAGEIFRFLGPNGAGKSTTIRMLCGLLRPTSGGGTVAGYDLGTRAERIKAEIGYMSQRFSLYEDLTVEENINFYSGIYGIPCARKRERKAWALAMAGLTSRRGMRTGALAGGWKQRLALGCAILHQPRIIFLDEPTAGVDPVSRRQFWDLIYALAAQGVTIFVTTHYMDEAEYCDRIGLIYRGDLIALGTPRELKNGMAQAAVLEVRCARPAEALEELRHHPNVREAALFGSSVHVVTAADAPAADLAVWLHQRGYATARCERIAPSLEDVFVAMIEAHDRADAARKDAT
jgi:ABC-2 type transport system ATP-binding protein